jgi:Protein of unknown function (DUF2934)
MEKSKDERIRERAHEMWETKGRPHGDHEADWHQAAKEIEERDREENSDPQIAGKAGLTQNTKEGPAASEAKASPADKERTTAAGPPTIKPSTPKAP